MSVSCHIIQVGDVTGALWTESKESFLHLMSKSSHGEKHLMNQSEVDGSILKIISASLMLLGLAPQSLVLSFSFYLDQGNLNPLFIFTQTPTSCAYAALVLLVNCYIVMLQKTTTTVSFNRLISRAFTTVFDRWKESTAWFVFAVSFGDGAAWI